MRTRIISIWVALLLLLATVGPHPADADAIGSSESLERQRTLIERPEAAPKESRLSGEPLEAFTRQQLKQSAAVHDDASVREVVVSFEQGKGAQALRAVRERGAPLKRHAKTGGFFVVDVPAGVSARDFAASLGDIDGVRYAEPDAVVSALLVPDDPSYPSQWGLPAIGAPSAWDVTMGSADVKIAIVDTGVKLDHPDLAGRIDVANGYDFVNNNNIADDDQGHGTHCAGIAAASTNNALLVAGVAGESTILPVKVLGRDGSGTNSSVADGIRWAANRGADVINLSLGSYSYSALIDEAVQYAVARDCVVVAASGNDSSYGVLYPARLPGVIAVGSTTSSNTRSSFSNYGPELDLCAPGTNILSTTYDGGVGTMSGTSMAAPHVAGVAALVRSLNPGWTRAQVEHQLTSTALDLGAAGRDNYFGHGLVQAGAAVGSTTPPPQPADPHDDIPGIEMPPSPVSGSVDRSTDEWDVYRLVLGVGQTLDLSLTSPSSADIDLFLYGPGATSVFADEPLEQSIRITYPEEITHTATRAGVYYVAVQAYSGSGSYTLSYRVSGAAPADDDIPGVPIPASPVTGSLTQPTDVDDVYHIDLSAGEFLTVSLTGPVGTDFDAYLFPPGTASVWTGIPVAYAIDISYPDAFTYRVPESGRYYLDIYAFSGSGSYTVNYSVTEAPPVGADDDIPGVPIGASPRTGSLDEFADPVDVYSCQLADDQRLTLEMTGPSGTDFDIYLFGPDATSVYEATPVARGIDVDYPERVMYVVPTGGAGTYYVAIHAYSGSGAYTLSFEIANAEDRYGPILFEDDFEVFPGVWDLDGLDGPGWGQTSYRRSKGSSSAYCAGSEIVAPGPYANHMETWMVAGPLDLSDEIESLLVFDLWLDCEHSFDWFFVGVSTDDQDYHVVDWSGDSDGWITIEVDLADVWGDGSVTMTGEPEVWLAFVFQSDYSIAFEGAYVDDVRVTGTPVPHDDPDDIVPPAISIAGGSRYETAVRASQEAFPDGADTVVIATGRNWPDALGGSALAGVLDAPILLVNTNSVPDVVSAEISRLGATRAVIVGGEVAVGPGVAAALQGAGLTVERIAGGSRYETADAVALRVIELLGEEFDGTAFVATGGAYADAVAAGPLAASQRWPLFLAHPTAGLGQATLRAMQGVTDVLVLGGRAAVSADVETALRESFAVTRLAGESRYGTAAVVAGHAVANTDLAWDRVGIATGQAYPDALAGGVLQGKVGSVMLLTRTNSLPAETAEALGANKATISTVTYFGGELAVSTAVRQAVSRAIQ